MIKIRAKVTVGGLTVKTPFITRFTVNKTRGNPSTFSASLKVKATGKIGTLSCTSTPTYIKIEAGGGVGSGGTASLKTIFSGIVQQATISPVFDDPTYVLLNISGSDILSTLRGKKYSRRSTATESSWVSIDSVVRRGFRSGKFAARLVEGEKVDTVETSTGGIDTISYQPEGWVQQNSRTGEDVPRNPLRAVTMTPEQPDEEEEGGEEGGE